MSASITDKFPIIGGIVFPVASVDTSSMLPAKEVIVQAIILAFIGAVIGYGVKYMFDKLRKL